VRVPSPGLRRISSSECSTLASTSSAVRGSSWAIYASVASNAASARGAHLSCFAGSPDMRRDGCTRSRHRVCMLYRATRSDLCVRSTCLSHITLAGIESVSEHELQHGSWRTPSLMSKFFEAALLCGCEGKRFHSGRSILRAHRIAGEAVGSQVALRTVSKPWSDCRMRHCPVATSSRREPVVLAVMARVRVSPK
jgi:hypothetical protein